jgi:eukaryotic-like serine/threonine-protein kinase
MLREEKLEAGAAITPTLRLVRPLGAGGMGAVWIARHLGLETNVVVKFIANTIADHPVAIARFKREAAAAASVRSPHVVQMLDYGLTEHGTPYIVMELLEGKDLSDYLRSRGRLPPREVVAIIRQVCKALQRAHDLGIIHRDIKPENIFLLDGDDDEPFVKLLDFGIAKDAEDVSVTTTGAAVGTPHYMSPEQCVGAKHIDHRTDLWSLGVLTFYLLTGRRPFSGETTGALTLAIFNGEIPKPTSIYPSLPKRIDAWFLRVCSRDPDGRPNSAKQLARELAEALDAASDGSGDDKPIIEPPPPPAAVEATVQYAIGGKAANTMERAPTTIKDLNPNAFVEAPARTTAGLSSGMGSSTAPRGVPAKSKAPIFIGGALLLGLAVGGAIAFSRKEPPREATPATSTIPAPKSIEMPKVEPAATPTPTPVPTPVASPVVPSATPAKPAPLAKGLPPKGPLTKSSGSVAKPPPPPGDVPPDLK